MPRSDFYGPLVAGAVLSRRKYFWLIGHAAKLEKVVETFHTLSRTAPIPRTYAREAASLAHAADLFFARHLPPAVGRTSPIGIVRTEHKEATADCQLPTAHLPPFPRTFDNTALAIGLMQRITLANELGRAATKNRRAQISVQQQRLNPIYPRGPERV